MSDARFIYRPKSGDRVFAHQAHETIVVVEWANGCRHVIGGTLLRYSTAVPGRWWRADAKVVATQVVASVGGIAWDDQGEVSLIVPTEWVGGVHRLMVAARELAGSEPTPGELDRERVALLLAGCDLAPGLWLDLYQVASRGPAPPLAVKGLRGPDWPAGATRPDVVGADGESVWPAAPSEWGVVSVTGGVDASA